MSMDEHSGKLLFLISFYLHYVLLNSEEIDSVKFNESFLMDKHHQNRLEVKSLMKDLEQQIKGKTRSIEHQYENVARSNEDLVSHFNISYLLNSGTARKDQKHRITKDLVELPAELVVSPRNKPHGLLLSSQELPPVTAKSSSSDHIALAPLKNPELRSGRPFPDLLSPRDSVYSGLMTPRNLLLVKFPGRYKTSFSYSPSPPRTAPKRLQVLHEGPSLKDHRHHGNLDELKSVSPPSISNPAVSSKMPPRLTTPFRTMNVHFHHNIPYLLNIKTVREDLKRQITKEPTKLAALKNSQLRSDHFFSGNLIRQRDSSYPGLMMNRNLLSVMGSGHYKASFSYSPSPARTASKRLPVLYKDSPLKDQLKIRPRNAKIWLQEIAPYTRVHKSFIKVSKDHAVSSQRGGWSTVPTPPRMAQARSHGPSTGTANTEILFTEDDLGFLYVTLPEIIPEDHNKTAISTIAGDVLFGHIEVKDPATSTTTNPYINLMEKMNEGYMMFFFIEMSRLIAEKDKHVVLEALEQMETIYNNKMNSGQLTWIDDPLQTIVSKMLMVPPGGYDAIVLRQAQLGIMYHMLQDRKAVLSPEVNFIINQADMLYNDEDGGRLLDAMTEFEKYPNTTDTINRICNALMETFLAPWHRAAHSPRRQALLDSINKALTERFPQPLRTPHNRTLRAGGRPKTGIQRKRRKQHQKRRKRRRQLKQINRRRDDMNSRISTPIPPDQKFRAITTGQNRMMSRTPKLALPLDKELYAHNILRSILEHTMT